MPLAASFQSIQPNIGAVVSGIDISKPLSAELIATLETNLRKYGLLLFKDVEWSADEQLRFATSFGKISRLGAFFSKMPDVIYVSNAVEDGILGSHELTFHSDKFYWKYPPKASMLYGMEVPSQGGDTLFANTAHVVRSMDPALRARLMNLKVRHELSYQNKYGAPGARVSDKLKGEDLNRVEIFEHPAIMKHPSSDNWFISVNVSSAKAMVGLPEAESRALMDEVNALIDRPENLYRHKWQKNDLVFWDNYLLQHARTPFPPSERRTLRRCQIAHELEGMPEDNATTPAAALAAGS